MAVLLICGGRDYADSGRVFGVLDSLQPRLVVHGACGVDADWPRWARLRGADRWAQLWCQLRRVPCIPVPARWSALGRCAGPVRNRRLLQRYRPALVVVFPGGRGTSDLLRRARLAGIPIWRVEAGLRDSIGSGPADPAPRGARN